MPFGEFTRQLATQALQNSAKDVLDALRPGDLSRASEAIRAAKPSTPAPGETVAGVVLGQVQAMQKALKEDEELVVLYDAGAETLRVLEIFVPAWNVVVLSGIDTERNITRAICPADSLRLVCKVMKAPAGAKPTRVGVLIPKPKAE